MKQIPITQGKFVTIDDEDFDWLNKYKWFARKEGKKYYAMRNKRKDDASNKPRYIMMHREILSGVLLVDHADRDTLNNQRNNLRSATSSQNAVNCSPTGLSKYIGVYKNNNYWVARVSHNKKSVHVSYHKTEYEAAKARDMAAMEYHKEFASLNFPQ